MSGQMRCTADIAACTHSGRNDGVEVVEAAGKEVRVDGRQLEAAVAQVHRRVEGDRVFQPLGAEPVLDLGALLEHDALEILERACE